MSGQEPPHCRVLNWKSLEHKWIKIKGGFSGRKDIKKWKWRHRQIGKGFPPLFSGTKNKIAFSKVYIRNLFVPCINKVFRTDSRYVFHFFLYVFLPSGWYRSGVSDSKGKFPKGFKVLKTGLSVGRSSHLQNPITGRWMSFL